eukprot:411915_1
MPTATNNHSTNNHSTNNHSTNNHSTNNHSTNNYNGNVDQNDDNVVEGGKDQNDDEFIVTGDDENDEWNMATPKGNEVMFGNIEIKQEAETLQHPPKHKRVETDTFVIEGDCDDDAPTKF